MLINNDFNGKNKIVYGCLLACGIIFFCFVGQQGYIMFDDSQGYMAPNLREGIMPVYSCFLNSIRIIAGERYLNVVSVIQGIIATVCTLIFVIYLDKRFSLQWWEVVALWILTLLPFSTELPTYVTSHVIYTEAVTYPLYYIFVIFYYEVLFSLGKRAVLNLIILWGIAFILAFTRPQLMLLFVLVAIVCAYKIFHMKMFACIKIFFTMLILISVVLIGVLSIYKGREIYVRTVGAHFLQEYSVEKKIADSDVKDSTIDNGSGDGAEEEQRDDEIIEGTGILASSSEVIMTQGEYERSTSNQLINALLCRTFFEADREDVKYYDTQMMKHIFERLYDECNKAGVLHNNISKGLWSWTEMMKTDIYQIYHDKVIYQYFLNPAFADEVPENMYFRDADVAKILIFTELQAHPVRFVLRCFRIMIPGFISCIFFNIKRIYFACHIISLALYIVAIVLANHAGKNGHVYEMRITYANILACIVFVGVTNTIFFGMQRYFLYQMGTFYCGLFLLFRLVYREKFGKISNVAI